MEGGGIALELPGGTGQGWGWWWESLESFSRTLRSPPRPWPSGHHLRMKLSIHRTSHTDTTFTVANGHAQSTWNRSNLQWGQDSHSSAHAPQFSKEKQRPKGNRAGMWPWQGGEVARGVGGRKGMSQRVLGPPALRGIGT